jgi:hypothetical protein
MKKNNYSKYLLMIIAIVAVFSIILTVNGAFSQEALVSGSGNTQIIEMAGRGDTTGESITIIEEPTSDRDEEEETTREVEEEEEMLPAYNEKAEEENINLKIDDVSIEANNVFATVCNTGDDDVSDFEIVYTIAGKENKLSYAPIMSSGVCKQIGSWYYGQMGLTLDIVNSNEVIVEVDPSNLITETNENDNLLTIEQEIEEEEDTFPPKLIIEEDFGLFEFVESKVISNLELEFSGTEDYGESGKYSENLVVYVQENEESISQSEFNSKVLSKLDNPDMAEISGQVIYAINKNYEEVYFTWVNNEYLIIISWAKPDTLSPSEESLTDDHLIDVAKAYLDKFPSSLEDEYIETVEAEEESEEIEFEEISTNEEVIEEVVEAEEEVNEEIFCNGCVTEQNTCAPFWTKLLDNEVAVYCDIDTEWKQQKELEEACQNNFECLSNQCINGACEDVVQQIKEAQGFIDKLITLIKNIFGIDLGEEEVEEEKIVVIEEEEEFKCTDSDGGNYPNIKGEATGYNTVYKNEIVTLEDSCLLENDISSEIVSESSFLDEKKCNTANPGIIYHYLHECNCVNGACVEEIQNVPKPIHKDKLTKMDNVVTKKINENKLGYFDLELQTYEHTPEPLEKNQKIKLKATIKNNGDSINEPFQIEFLFCDINAWSGQIDCTSIAIAEETSILMGEEKTYGVEVDIPEDLIQKPIISMFGAKDELAIKIIVDSEDQIEESDQDNNEIMYSAKFS